MNERSQLSGGDEAIERPARSDAQTTRSLEPACCEGPRSNSSPCKIRQINIEQLDYGYVVRVGCQSFAVENYQFILEKLEGYFKNPESTEKEWMANKKF